MLEEITQEIENNEEVASQEGGEKLAGKYNSVEDLEKGYQELLKQFSGVKATQENVVETKEEIVVEEIKQEEIVEEKQENKTLDTLEIKEETKEENTVENKLTVNDVLNKLFNGDEISEDEIKDLGLNNDILSKIKENNEKVENLNKQEKLLKLTEKIGGVDEYSNMIKWAMQNLSKEEQTRFNEYTKTEHAELAVENLYSKYKSANPTESNVNLAHGTKSAEISKKGFASQDEVTFAMQDSRYNNDPNYMKSFNQKLKDRTFN